MKKLLLTLLLSLFFASNTWAVSATFLDLISSGDSGFPSGWERKCALVIQSSQVTSDVSNFPVLIAKASLPSEIFDADGSYYALNGGGDIRFSSDSAGNTQLPCEIEEFVTDNDPANGKSSIWVKVSSISSSSNTTIYIWYHKSGESQPAINSAYGAENVWDSNFKMVQHLQEDPSGGSPQMIDSTSNDNDGTSGGTMLTEDQVAGQIDGSLDFEGTDDCITTPYDPDTYTAGSISLWVKANATANSPRIWAAGASQLELLIYSTKFNFYGAGFDLYTGSPIINIGQWYHVFCTWSTVADTAEIFVDGTSTNLDTNINIPATSTLTISSVQPATSNFFYGLIDEFHVSNVIRADGWITTEYNNQSAPNTFLVEGTPE